MLRATVLMLVGAGPKFHPIVILEVVATEGRHTLTRFLRTTTISKLISVRNWTKVLILIYAFSFAII